MQKHPLTFCIAQKGKARFDLTFVFVNCCKSVINNRYDKKLLWILSGLEYPEIHTYKKLLQR